MDFPSGPVVKKSLAEAGDMGSFPGLRRSHLPRGNWACTPQLPSWCSRTCALQQEKPTQLETNTLQLEKWPPLATNRESLCTAMKIQHSQK